MPYHVVGRGPLLALQFLTRVPISVTGQVEEHELADAMCWYPLVGGALGCVAAALAVGLAGYLPPQVVAALTVAFLTVITGNLHLDGLMDTADGLYGGYNRERRLEIMRDSRSGAHGVVAGSLVLLLKWALVSSLLLSKDLPWALPLALASSRWSLVLAARSQPPARSSGLGQLYTRHLGSRHLIWATVAWLLTAGLVLTVASLSQAGSLLPEGGILQPCLALVAAPIVALWFGRYVSRKIGGMTGDTLGATNELVEIAMLLLLIADVA